MGGRGSSRSSRPSRWSRSAICRSPTRRASPSRAWRSPPIPEMAWEYTARGNLVAVVTNGTAVLGLGNIGPLAGKPVMEGKACLFKKFADIDVFDLEVDARDSAGFIDVVAALEPTFGGINLEDLEGARVLRDRGRAARRACASRSSTTTSTAPPSSRARRCSTAPSSPARSWPTSRSSSRARAPRRSPAPSFYVSLGVPLREHHAWSTRVGVIYAGRNEGMNQLQGTRSRARTTARARSPTRCAAPTCSWACRGAGSCTPEMLKTMAQKPLIFALANPDPEIGYPDAKAARPDAHRRDRAAATSRTRSTTSSASRTSSAARSTCAPRRSTRR